MEFRLSMENQILEVSIVTSVKNEQATIGILLDYVSKTLTNYNILHEIIVIDHNSTDKTEELLNQKKREITNLRVFKIRNSQIKLGQALQIGISNAIGQYIITLDGDLSHPVKYLPLFIEKMRDGHDLIIGGRYLKNQARFNPFSRYIISKLFNIIPKSLIHKQISDYTTGYRGFKRILYQPNTYSARDFDFHVEFNIRLVKNAQSPIELPINYVKRRSGESKLRYSRQFKGYLVGIFHGILKN